MRTAKLLGAAGALIAAALVGGTLIGSALAQSSPGASPATAANNAAYCQTFLDTFASKLGVSKEALLPAAKAAAVAAVDAAVKAGDLTADVAAAAKTRINAATGDGCALLGARFGHLGEKAGRHVLTGDLVSAAAGALKLTPDALTTQLRAGKSLKDVAAAQKVDYATVSKAVSDAAKADLDKAVAAGNLTRARADEMLSRLNAALASGDFPKGGRHGPDHDAGG
ncbi:MAG: hypothetical protein ABJB65_05610 [Chloroflexota bacterium]